MGTSASVTGFWLVHALRLPGGLRPAMEELLSLVNAGRLRPVVGGTYPLDDVRRAHEDLLARRSTGKLVLQVR
jgi:NADPH2:quinone reductase